LEQFLILGCEGLDDPTKGVADHFGSWGSADRRGWALGVMKLRNGPWGWSWRSNWDILRVNLIVQGRPCNGSKLRWFFMSLEDEVEVRKDWSSVVVSGW